MMKDDNPIRMEFLDEFDEQLFHILDKCFLDNTKYLCFNNSNNKKTYYHRFKWISLNGKIPEDFEIHHIDRNKLNNNILNLMCIHKSAHKTLHSTGKNNSMFGKYHTQESKDKISALAKGRYVGKNNPMYGTCRKINTWSKKNNACIICSSAEFKHAAKEMCKKCYAKIAWRDFKNGKRTKY